jgi:hypothetical protein
MARSVAWTELGDPEVRELILASYRLLYEIRAEAVYILGLIHGARDLATLWEREGEHRREDPEPPRSH